MRNRLLFTLATAGALAGCGFLDDPPELEEFIYEESTHGVTIEPGIDVASIYQSIALVGQLNTPSPCYGLSARLEHRGSDLTVHVTAQQRAGNCEDIVGFYRYQAVIRNLSDGTYQFRVRHTFEGSDWPAQEFTVPITVN